MRDDQTRWGGPFPSLHLWPVQDTFAMKMIYLPEGQRVKVGRQTNTKTVPAERNAYFDSKVLSRLHAEIWEHSGKIYIKDVKSSNGTFINGDRLSPEGVESEPRELHNEDLVEFGIDIVSDDNRTIVHHKVAAKVYCVFNSEDAALSATELLRQSGPRRGPAAGPPVVLSAGGKANGLSFEHVLQKLQAELSRSKETGNELQSLTSSMSEIQDVLGGGLSPDKNGSAASFIPPQFRAGANGQNPHEQSASAFLALQNQLSDTQASLNGQTDKILHLESQVKSHDSLLDEIAHVKEELANQTRGRSLVRDRDDDDARSVHTVMEDEEAEERVRERRRQAASIEEENAKLAAQVQSLSAEVAEAVRQSQTWQAQHSDAMDAVRLLTERVGALEVGIASRIAEEVSKTETRWQSWRATLEDGWKKEKESWDKERERLRSVVRDWEEASRRAHEEEEERELNDRLSSGSGSDGETEPPPPRRRRRRPSSRTSLAVRALRNVADDAGSSAAKQTLDSAPQRLRSTVTARRGSASTLKRRPSSSESDSGDTLSEPVREKTRKNTIQPGPIIVVGFIAIIVGAVYYQNRE